MFNRYSRKDIKLEIISGTSKFTVKEEFDSFIGNHDGCFIMDIKVTECDDSYTMWIFYKE